MTHGYQVQKNRKSEFRSKGGSQCRRHKGLRCASSSLKSFVWYSLGEKTWNRTPKNIYTTSQCVNKAQWLLEITLHGAVSLFSLLGGRNKLKLHNLTVNLIIHSPVKKKNYKRNKAKRNKAASKCILNKNGWRKKFHVEGRNLSGNSSVCQLFDSSNCASCFFSAFFSAFNFGFFCLLFCFKWLSWNHLSFYALFDILLQFF